MYSKQNTKRKQKTNFSKSIYTARSERSSTDVEIHKHFNPKNRDERYSGVESLPIIGDVDSSNVEVSVNINKPNKTTKKTFIVNDPTEISLDVVFPDEIESNVEFFTNDNDNFNNNAIQIETCTSLNKKVEDINKQLADLEKDIQFNFYDPKTKVGSNLKKYSSQLQSFSSSKNVSNTTSTASDYGNFNKFNTNQTKTNDPSIELKNEIFNYRSTLKQKDFEEKIEKRLEKLHKQKEQSESRKYNETKEESGHEPSCPLSLKIDLPEPVLKIHEMQLAAKRLKSSESGVLNNIQNATSSQTTLQKVDQTTIQNKNEEPSTSKSKSPTPIDNENNAQASLSSINIGVVQQLDTLLKKSTSELDELKDLLRAYLDTEKANSKKVPIKNVPKKKTKINALPSSSNSDVSLPSRNKKRTDSCQKVNIEKKSKVIEIKQISKSTKTTKCGLSDISESNEVEPNSSSSDVNKKAIKKHKNKKPIVSKDKQQELILNIASKSDPSLCSSDENRLIHIRNFIQQLPKDPNDLLNPPNTVRLVFPESMDSEPESKKDYTGQRKNILSVQILPPLDIPRALTTQKLPTVAIESRDDFEHTSNTLSSENVKYIQIKHLSDKDLPKEESSQVIHPKAVKEQIHINKDTSQDVSKKSPPQIPDTIEQDETLKDSFIELEKPSLKEIYLAANREPASIATLASIHPSSESQNIKKKLPEKKVTVREELNLDIESLPSVRTLKEIQSYLEQKCSIIRCRLQEESKLKTGETLSLRYKLSEPPCWQTSTADPPNETITLEEKPKTTTLSPLKTYAPVKTPLAPLAEKHDNAQQVKYNPSLIGMKTQNAIDKSLQTSFTENIELPIGRAEQAGSSSHLSTQTTNRNIQEVKEIKTPPPQQKTSENTESIYEITVNLKDACTSCHIESDEKNILPKNQVTEKPLTDIIKFTNISTQINESDLPNEPNKHVPFDIVTANQVSVNPKEDKETQISQIEPKEKMTKTPQVVECKSRCNQIVQKDKEMQTNKETQVKEKQAPAAIVRCMQKEKQAPVPIVRCMQSKTTQKTEVKDSYTVCNLPETHEKEIVQILITKETKDCCTQYSPTEQPQQLNTTEYKQINSFKKADFCENQEDISKHVHYPAEERRHYYKSKLKNKRPVAAQRYKVCSTPVSASTSSISAEETMSFSDGEMKLSCQCSTSIGEIHLCRFANDIRKKVRILKKNPEKVIQESFGGGGNYKITREHKYNDNWFAYYVTKTGSSSENGTGSNLSSIKSNIETE